MKCKCRITYTAEELRNNEKFGEFVCGNEDRYGDECNEWWVFTGGHWKMIGKYTE